MGTDPVTGVFSWEAEDNVSWDLPGTVFPGGSSFESKSRILGSADLTIGFNSAGIEVSARGLVDNSGHLSRERVVSVSIGIDLGDGYDVRLGLNSQGAYLSVGNSTTPLDIIDDADIKSTIEDVLDKVYRDKLRNV